MTYNAPEYIIGRGGTADLLILFISACISCKIQKSSIKVHVMIKLDSIMRCTHKCFECRPKSSHLIDVAAGEWTLQEFSQDDRHPMLRRIDATEN